MAVSTTMEKNLSPRVERFLLLLLEALRQGTELAPTVGQNDRRRPQAVSAK